MSRNKENKYENNRGRTHTIMAPDEAAAGKKSRWTEMEITGNVRNLSPHIWRLTHLTALYLNDNSLIRLPPEVGSLQFLVTLDLSGNKLRSLPLEIGDLLNLKDLFLNHNCIRSLPCEIGKLFQLQSLGLKGNPLPPDIVGIYNEPNGTAKLLSFLLDNLNITTPQPPSRPWIILGQPDRTRPTCIFTVLCYNVLCDKLATRQMYGYCPNWALEWEYRKKGILDEIKHYSADIISLQEIETDQFYNFFLPELKRDGYDGIFSPKSRAKTMLESERKYVDGCAIFYRTAKFSLMFEHLVEFNQLAMANAEGSDDMLNRVMTKDNIGLAALLETKEAAWSNGIRPDPSQIHQPLLVCTAHIHWDPEYCDVKLIQTMMLMNEVKQIINEAGHSFRPNKSDSGIQVLLCGDLNSLPDSGVVEFLSHGRIGNNHSDFKDFAYKSCLQKLSTSADSNEYTHPFRLSSAYNTDIMPFSNYTYDFKGLIDYIFYSKTSMVPLGLLGPIDPEWFRVNKVIGCPHPHIPSDHFPLLVELEMAPNLGTLTNGLIPRR
uniref:poly(A)-specific ribonuclease n=1 Tax=Lynceus sp. MCZ IZ 141354 TaxID=1930659 RepID=A0A9N6ZH60_9CRUS|nr:EOG090X06K5 [Lynceus sp. MCZ IZ 141354]